WDAQEAGATGSAGAADLKSGQRAQQAQLGKDRARVQWRCSAQANTLTLTWPRQLGHCSTRSNSPRWTHASLPGERDRGAGSAWLMARLRIGQLLGWET